MEGGAAAMGRGKGWEQEGTLGAREVGALACSEHVGAGEVRLWMFA